MQAQIKNLRSGERERLAYCLKCGNEVSADKADYFMATEEDTLKCCGRVMEVATKETTVEFVS